VVQILEATKKPRHYVGEASQDSGLEKEDVGKGSTRMGVNRLQRKRCKVAGKRKITHVL
jgi:hypothetical protein